jgi:hypothetical protein
LKRDSILYTKIYNRKINLNILSNLRKVIKFTLLSLILNGCASNYLSLDQVRQSHPQRSLSSPLPLDVAFENVLTQASECYAINIYKIVSLRRDKSAEVSVISSGATSGANVWLTAILQEISTSETKVSLYWGNVNWEPAAEKAAQWSLGSKSKC